MVKRYRLCCRPSLKVLGSYTYLPSGISILPCDEWQKVDRDTLYSMGLDLSLIWVFLKWYNIYFEIKTRIALDRVTYKMILKIFYFISYMDLTTITSN